MAAPASAQAEPFPTASGEPDAFAITPYKVLDNLERSWVNLNVAPVRPMTMTADQLHIYAVNTHGSVVQHYNNLSGQPAESFRVPWAPVSVAIWPDFAETELLVVCQGSHSLVRLDRVTGETLRTLDLPFEPADLIVDHVRGRAFVSCKGVDSVVEIDLPTNTIVQTYEIPSKAPVFLSFDANGTDVLVAPSFSGNNSFVHKTTTLQAQILGIIDGETNQFVVNGLPDEDLFRIDPVAQTVEAVLVDAGTVLFAHGVNPETGDLWLLNTDANNKDPNAQGEPAINGFAVQNRLSIATLPAPGGGTVTPHTVLDLDDADETTPGTQYDPTRSVGQPYSLEFDSAGNALITGLLTDNVIALRPGTSFLTEFDLAEGSIPRQTMFWGTSSVFVYCWGTNVIEMWDLSNTWTQIAELDLGHDPTPELIARGREVFYDASHSLNNNQSCASCHVEGKTDMITWDLSDLPRDDKGPMTTQTLAGIDLTPPFHWRGERPGLIDFNGAFPGLLGGPPLSTTRPANGTPSEFEQFEAFVLSLATTANPFQDRHRVVSDATTIEPPPGFPVGSPVAGQVDYHDPNGTNCEACHTMPMGTNSVMVADARFDPNPKRTHFEVAHFKEVWRKEQDIVTVDFVGGISIDYPVTGSGLGHAGTSNSLFDFVNDLFNLDDQATMDMVTFVMQADQGLAPMVHEIEHLNASTLPVAAVELTRSFIPQADARNIDLAVYGTVEVSGSPQSLGWYYDRDDRLFYPEVGSIGPRSLRFFLERAPRDTTNLVFVGLPVGMGLPWAADADDDGLLNGDEVVEGTDPFVADSDADGAPDGYEVLVGSSPIAAFDLPVDNQPAEISNLRLQWITAKVAKLSWETNEPTTFRIDYGTTIGAPGELSGTIARRVHSAVLPDLLPSTFSTGTVFTYTGTLTAFDLGNNPTVENLPAGMTTVFQNETENVVLGDLRMQNLVQSIPTGTLVANVLARVDRKTGGPPSLPRDDHVVIATVQVNGVISSNFTSPLPTSFMVGGAPPAIQGPWVMSLPSTTDGSVELDFTLNGVNTGDEVRINIEGVIPVSAGYDPDNPNFALPNPMGRWNFPATPEALRAIVLQL